jgi:hypothetical protein
MMSRQGSYSERMVKAIRLFAVVTLRINHLIIRDLLSINSLSRLYLLRLL